MHILMTVNAAWNLVNFRAPLIRHFLADGHKVSVLAPEDSAFGDLRAWGCTCVPLEMDVEGLSPPREFALMRRMRAHFRVLQPDVVLSFTIKNNVFGAWAARPLGVPFIPTVTGLGTAFLSGRVLERVTEALYRFAFRTCPAVVFQNEDDASLFDARKLVRRAQIHLSPGSGIDTAAFVPKPLPDLEDGVVFLLIARMLSAKGVQEYVQAAREIRKSNPQARFQLLGPTDSRNRHAIPVEALQGWVAEGVVEYLGQTDDVRPAIQAAHCVVLPSYREGTPRTLLEAACMARPLIATDVPGCRQVVVADQTGLLCDVKSANSLARAFERFLTMSPAAWTAMGRAGRVHMEETYDVRNVTLLYAYLVKANTRLSGFPQDILSPD